MSKSSKAARMPDVLATEPVQGENYDSPLTDSQIVNDVLAAGADHALQAQADLTPAPAPKPPRDKAQSFRRLRDRRLSKAVKVINYLIPLANKNAYTYSEAQAAEIVEVLTEALADVKRAFAGTRSAQIVRQFL